jgi:SAM-dependent methyltransferase
MIGFSEPRSTVEGTTDDRIYQSSVQCLTDTLGRDPQIAQERSRKEVSREMARQLVGSLRAKGWDLVGKEILDVGSGYGALAVELALAGARVTALEPCIAFRELSEERAAALGLSIRHMDADAHHLPFPDESFDGVVSLQVLEHVENPKQAIHEIARVLKPGATFHIACENYLAPLEPHYHVFWLPGLPKLLGSLYLRLRGRDPQFLRDHITYVYWPGLARTFLRAGLADSSWESALPRYATNPKSIAWKRRLIYRTVAALAGHLWAETTLVCVMNRRRLLRPDFTISGRKPVSRC